MNEDIRRRFDYHPPLNERTREAHEDVREETKALAAEYEELLPEGRQKALAITKLEEAMFWANAAIARNGGPKA